MYQSFRTGAVVAASLRPHIQCTSDRRAFPPCLNTFGFALTLTTRHFVTNSPQYKLDTTRTHGQEPRRSHLWLKVLHEYKEVLNCWAMPVLRQHQSNSVVSSTLMKNALFI